MGHINNSIKKTKLNTSVIRKCNAQTNVDIKLTIYKTVRTSQARFPRTVFVIIRTKYPHKPIRLFCLNIIQFIASGYVINVKYINTQIRTVLAINLIYTATISLDQYT